MRKQKRNTQYHPTSRQCRSRICSRQRQCGRNIALHYLCSGSQRDEAAAVQILKFLLDKHPEAVRRADNRGNLPIHSAAQKRSPDFCRVLIEAYPGSDRIADANGVLPLHYACFKGSLETVEYLYSLYREAIHHDTPGGYPIHALIAGTQFRGNPAVAVEVVQFLLNRDPHPHQKQFDGEPLLQSACWGDYDDSNIKAAIQVIKILFDVQPEAIEENRIASNIQDYHQQVQAFINGELVYARQAKDLRLMSTPDDNGQLPLHVALQNNVRLGSIKLLVKGNPAAVLSPDNSGALPLHSACQHHDSTSVVSYLVGLDPSTLDAVDREGNTALHYACRGAKYETITLLLEKYDAVSVSKQNTDKKLPINLLWESTAVENRESIEYTGSVFQLLKAYPETVMNNNVKDMTSSHNDVKKRKRVTELGVCSSHSEKKRKRDTV